MARKRMIDPNFWESVDVWKLTIRQRLLAIALFSLADDEGRGTADPLWLKVKVFPHDEEVKARDIEDDLRNIEKSLSLVLYESSGKKFYAWTNWTKWQKVEKKTKSAIPEPPEKNPQPFGEDSGNSRGEVGEYSEPKLIEVNRTEYEENEENMKRREGCGEGNSPDDQCSSLENAGHTDLTEPTNGEHSIRSDQCAGKKKTDKKIKYAEFVSMTNAEYEALVAKLGSEERTKRCIEILDNYKGASGKKYKSDYRAILNWVIARLEEEEERKGVKCNSAGKPGSKYAVPDDFYWS